MAGVRRVSADFINHVMNNGIVRQCHCDARAKGIVELGDLNPPNLIPGIVPIEHKNKH